MSSTITETATTNYPARIVAAQQEEKEKQEDQLPPIPPAEKDKAFQSLVRGNRAGTLKLRGSPVFADVYAKRQWMKEHMAAAFRFFGKQGYGEGVSGHISMRGL